MGKNEIILSIIVPVYNTEKYLNRCLKSLSEQPSKQIEIIVVNDGSTDNSKEICKYWTNQDERMILFSKFNEGVSAARNDGMQLACGKYYYFIDSDDWIEKDQVERILNYLEKAQEYDLLLTSLTVNQLTADRISHKLLSKEQHFIQNDDTLGQLLMDHRTVGGFVTNKVFSAELIQRHNLMFKKGMTMMEDLNFVLDYFSYMTKPALYVPLCGYHYEINSNSVTFNQKDKKRKEEYVVVINSFFKTLNMIPKQHKKTRELFFHFIVGESARFAMYLSATDEYYDKKYLSSIVRSHLIRYMFSNQNVIKKGKTVCYTAITFLYDVRTLYQTTYIKGDKHV